MSVETIYKVILYPFINESIASLKAMASVAGESDDAFMDKVEDFRFKGYAVCSDITGSLDGVIMMHHYPETAVAIGNAVCQNMFGETYDYSEINEELGNALAEWGNTIVGRSTDLHSRHNLDYQFSSPYFVNDVSDMDKYLVGVKEIVTVPIKIDGIGRYYFNLLVRSASISGGGLKRDESQGVANPYSTALPTDSRILLVDDSSLIRKGMKRFLSQIGYTNVDEVDDGAKAVAMVKDNCPDFIFMDVIMGEVNGNEALKAMREAGSDVPVVMLSSVTDQELIDECQALGISGFIFKPINSENGPQTLKDYLKIA
ncbi:response regulator [Neptunicella marina]|uniref:Response regulator n=1 Tax=Neptunicella marina TaxID=2125989 RepID=A0A8J6LZQ5_9ALTE|nr:response regulator [Neptunicella marina]MBC3766325.1 response regulator [Neptunicella marina]